MLTVLYLNLTIENASVTSKAFVGDNRSTLCAAVIQNLVFATSGFVNEIVAITQKICYVDVYDLETFLS